MRGVVVGHLDRCRGRRDKPLLSPVALSLMKLTSCTTPYGENSSLTSGSCIVLRYTTGEQAGY